MPQGRQNGTFHVQVKAKRLQRHYACVPGPELSSADHAQLAKAQRTRMNEFMQRHCRRLLQGLMDRPFGVVFSNPVDTTLFPTYPEFVKKPMDFGTIRKQIDSGAYSSLAAFIADVNLVLDNARVFNAPGSQVYHMANALQVRSTCRSACCRFWQL